MGWIQVVVAIGEYILAEKKDARKASDLTSQLTKVRNEIVKSVTDAIKAAFAKEKMDDACNEIEQAQDLIDSAEPSQSTYQKVVDHCTRARALLTDPEIALAGHPFYVAAVTLQVSALETLKSFDEAKRIAAEGSDHFRNLQTPAEAGVGSRFHLKQVLGIWIYYLDGKEVFRGAMAAVKERMAQHRRELTRETLLPLRRTASLWQVYAKGLGKPVTLSLRAANGFLVSLGPDDRVTAWADSATDPLTRFELFRKNGTAALLATNGMFVSAEAMDLIRCREVMLGPLTKFSWESGKNDLVLKSIHLNRYLTAQRTHGDPEWLIQCSDSAPSRYSTFEQIA